MKQEQKKENQSIKNITKDTTNITKGIRTWIWNKTNEKIKNKGGKGGNSK